jgi:preprotein translocase subunit SecG
MQLIFLVIQIVISVLLIGVVLLQRDGGDSISGLGGGGNNVVSSQSSSNFLNKTTIILAILFMLNSLFLANISARTNRESVVEKVLSDDQETAVPVAK